MLSPHQGMISLQSRFIKTDHSPFFLVIPTSFTSPYLGHVSSLGAELFVLYLFLSIKSTNEHVKTLFHIYLLGLTLAFNTELVVLESKNKLPVWIKVTQQELAWTCNSCPCKFLLRDFNPDW